MVVLEVPEAGRRLVEPASGWVPWSTDGGARLGHQHRYQLIAAMASDREVLVLGTGEGTGPALLATIAKRVVAVEASSDAIFHARHNYSRPNLTFIHGLPHELIDMIDDRFDLIVALEAAIDRPRMNRIVAGAPRLLGEGGVFLAAVPASEGAGAEVADVVKEHFSRVASWRQVVVASLVAEHETASSVTCRSDLLACEHLIVAGSERPIEALVMPDGDLVAPRTGDACVPAPGHADDLATSVDVGVFAGFDELRLARQVVAYDAAIAELLEDLRSVRLDGEHARANLELAEIRLSQASGENASLRQQAAAARAEAEHARRQLALIETTMPRRVAAGIGRALRRGGHDPADHTT